MTQSATVKRYSAMVYLSMTPDGVALADPEARTVVLASDYDALAAELGREKHNNTALYSSLERTVAERDAALSELEKARRDAERYRWLRRTNTYRPFIAERGPGGISQLTDEYADAAIDAALSPQSAKEKP